MTHPAHPVHASLEAALEVLKNTWEVFRPNAPNPFANTSERFECATFSVHAYSWGDEAQPWNFKWRDVEISWYKYFGRSMSTSSIVSEARTRQLVRECLPALLAEIGQETPRTWSLTGYDEQTEEFTTVALALADDTVRRVLGLGLGDDPDARFVLTADQRAAFRTLGVGLDDSQTWSAAPDLQSP